METAMATKVVESIVEKLGRMVADEVALLAGVKDDVRNIVAQLKSITSFLKDMSTKRNLDNGQQNWVQEMREVAYDAEDLIDEFNCCLRSTTYDERGVKGFFKHFLRCIKSLKVRHGNASELKILKDEIEEIRRRHPSSGIATSSDIDDSYFDPRIIGHFVEEAQLVSINQNRNTLIEWVMDENRLEPTVISLVGFGGLGKTTLAKTVYDDSIIVGGHFQCRAWITVSQNYSITELLKKIIRRISVAEQQIRDGFGCQDASLNTEQILNMMDVSQLAETVRGHLHGKRYLLVFDDVWSTKAWESLSIVLPCKGKEGSRVIVTTRIEEVANACCSNNHKFIFKISPLSADLSWELFRRKVFAAPDYDCPPELENVGREIVLKCSGMPLAIVTIGGLLASKPHKKLEEWKDLRHHLRSEIQANDMLSKIHQILVLSYNDLPYHLKPCFLFLSIFPEDYEIPRKRLIRRWIAEGIVSGVGTFTAEAEKDAERCFNQLVSRSLVQPSEFDDKGTVKYCRVHDMMLEVIISISKEENFAVLLNEHPPRDQKIRRLSWHGEGSGLVPDIDLSHLRSFTAFGKDIPLKDYRKQRLLRAIDLEGSRNLFDLQEKSFSKLFLLKYLSLKDSPISVLPDSTGDLLNLEFLDIRGTYIVELPDTIVKLQKLVYLLADGSDKKHSLMQDMKLFNIVMVPKGIGKLKKLAALGMLRAYNVQLLQEIGKLVNLQKLGICSDLNRGMQEGLSALLSKLSGSLRSLTICQDSSGDLKRALDEVASPPLLLCKLQIHAQLGGLPSWFASLNQVVKITLHYTFLSLQDLQVLRNLHTLVKLVLGVDSFDIPHEDLVFGRGGFANLKFLEIQSHWVSFEEGALQSLQILKLYSRDNYRLNGIEHLHGLG